MSLISPRLSPADILALKTFLASGGTYTATTSTAPIAGTTSTYTGANALTGGAASTPSQAAFTAASINLLDIRLKIAGSALTSTNGNSLVSCWQPSDVSGWQLILLKEGHVGINLGNSAQTGNVNTYVAGNAPISISTTADTWIRGVFDATNATAQTFAVYTSSDNVNYTQFWNTQNLGSSAKIFANTVPLTINAAAIASGMIRGVQIIAGATKIVDVDFTVATAGVATVTANTGQIFTIAAPASIAASTSTSVAATPAPTPAATTVSNASISYNGPMVAATVPATTTLWGTYLGDLAIFAQDHTAWLGKAPELGSVHTGQASESDFRGSISYCIGSAAFAGNNCVSIPLSWKGPDPATPASMAAILKQCGAGTFNADYTFAAQEVLRMLGNQSPIYIRTGWENNLFQQMPWSSTGNEPDFIAAFRNLVTCFRAVDTKHQFVYIYGPNIGAPFEPAYPGDAYCDGVGFDFYINTAYGDPSDPYLCWDYMLRRAYGIEALETFCTTHNKFMCFPEYGINMDFFGPYFDLFYKWCITRNVRYANYWDSNGDYPSVLSEYSQLLANGAAYRHLHNPSKYPQRPIVQCSLMRNAQDVSQGPWFQGYMANGTATRTVNTIAFDGVGNGSQNQQIAWVLDNAPAGNYVFTTTVTRTAGTDTASIWIGDGTPSIAGVDLTTAKAPLNQATRIAVPFTLTQRMSNLKVVIYHGQPGTVTVKLTDFGLWEDMTTDPFPQAGIVAPTPPSTLLAFTGSAGAPTGSAAPTAFDPTTPSNALLDGSGALQFNGTNQICVFSALGAQPDGYYTAPVKVGGTAPALLRFLCRMSGATGSFSGYVIQWHYSDGAPSGSVDMLVFNGAGSFKVVVLTGGGGAPMPQRSIGVRLKGNVVIAYVDDIAVGSAGDASVSANGAVGLGATNCGFTSITYTA